MKIDGIYVNGDSYSAADPPDSDSDRKVYSQWLQTITEVACVNHAVPGSSNDRIIRTTINHCLRAKHANRRLFVIIGVSYFTREEIWWPGSLDYKPASYPFYDSIPSDFVSLDAVMNQDQVPDGVKQSALLLDNRRQVIHGVTKILMLCATLRDWQFPYLIFSGPSQNQSFHGDQGRYWRTVNDLPLWQELVHDANVWSLVEWSLSDWGRANDPEQTGTHLRPQGHEKFAEFILDRSTLSLYL